MFGQSNQDLQLIFGSSIKDLLLYFKYSNQWAM